jgi:glycosyltransferase involved in cell wall biosynthesis
MRVLVTHNFYRSSAPSGENQLVRAETALLRDAGVDVVEMFADSDTIPSGVRGVLRAAPGPVYSPSGVRRFSRLLRESTPDVVHLHHVTPLISPWVVRVAGRYGVPVVHTVHAYRHSCVNGLHLRDGRVCTDCVGTRLNLPSVRHGCYRDSRVQTVPVTIGLDVHRGTWRDGVDRFLALTPFMRDMLVAAGIPGERITVRPTWVPDPGVAEAPGQEVLYVGRLDEAKGIDRLLEAWRLGGRASGRRLTVIGDGPLRAAVENAVQSDDRVRWLGQVPPAEVAAAMEQAAYLVVPSRVFEGYPLAVAEAFGRGRPVLTVSGGSVGTIVDDRTGWVVDPTAEALAAAIARIDDNDAASREAAARASYEEHNTPERGLASLLEVYREVLSKRLS